MEAFLFSLTHKTKHKVRTTSNNSYALYDNNSKLPTFGGGHDLTIYNNANENMSSYTNFGYSFESDPHNYGSTEAKNYLAGAYNF